MDAGGEGSVAEIRRKLAQAREAIAKDVLAEPGQREVAALGVEPSDEHARAALLAALEYVAALGRLPTRVACWLARTEVGERLASLKGSLAELDALAQSAKSDAENFQSRGIVNWTRWLRSGVGVDSAESLPVRAARQRISVALNAEPALYTWARYVRARAAAVDVSATAICEMVEGGTLPPSSAAEAYEAAVFATIANGILRADGFLDRFSGQVHEQVRARFAALDEQALEMSQL